MENFKTKLSGKATFEMDKSDEAAAHCGEGGSHHVCLDPASNL